MSPDDPRHGTTNGYGHGCRCEACKAAKRDYMRGYMRRRRAAVRLAVEDESRPA